MLKLTLYLHVVAAIFWIGGMLFLSLVVVPYLNTLKDPQAKRALYRAIGPRFRTLSWIMVAILVITGPLNMYYLGFSPLLIFDGEFLSTGYGKAVLVKVLLVLLIMASSLLHDFWVGPKARTSQKFSTLAKIFGRGNLFVALIITLLAVIIRAGGF